jgi:putative sporulation protein YtaF
MSGILALALTVSLDSLMAGVAYGARNIRLPLAAIAIVSLLSALTMYTSMTIGTMVGVALPSRVARMVGAVVLIALGLYAICRQLMPVGSTAPTQHSLPRRRVRAFGEVLSVWRDPLVADRDGSGGISPYEAVVLGMALALDAFGAGLGAALQGLPPIATASTTGMFNLLLLPLGLCYGRFYAGTLPARVTPYLSGTLLIILGVWRLV